jgi:hypothetical protein
LIYCGKRGGKKNLFFARTARGGWEAHCKLESPAATAGGALVLCLVSLKLEAITHTQTSTVSRLLYIEKCTYTMYYFYFVFEYNFSVCFVKKKVLAICM